MMATGGAWTKEEPLKLVELWGKARRAKMNIRTVLRLQFPWHGASSAERFSFTLGSEPQMWRNAVTSVEHVASFQTREYGNEPVSSTVSFDAM